MKVEKCEQDEGLDMWARWRLDTDKKNVGSAMERKKDSVTEIVTRLTLHDYHLKWELQMWISFHDSQKGPRIGATMKP